MEHATRRHIFGSGGLQQMFLAIKECGLRSACFLEFVATLPSVTMCILSRAHRMSVCMLARWCLLDSESFHSQLLAVAQES